MFETATLNSLSYAQRLAIAQSAWSSTERRRRRSLAVFMQRRLAWQIALDTAKHTRGTQLRLA
jgi:hypothetical protein